MGHTIVGTFVDSSDADLAAAELREEHALFGKELDIIGQAEADRLEKPGITGETAWYSSALFAIGLSGDSGGYDEAVGKRWGDKVWQGETLVVARTEDPTKAEEIVATMHRVGASRVDLIPH